MYELFRRNIIEKKSFFLNHPVSLYHLNAEIFKSLHGFLFVIGRL